MHRPLNILAPTRYPWRFNGPRSSRHHIHIRNFLPFNRLDRRLEGVTAFSPLPPKKFDLIHAFNRIPLGFDPYVIGFESHLPRGFGLEKSAYYDRLFQSLASERCRGVVAISECAKAIFVDQAQERPGFDSIEQKLSVRYPNLVIPPVIVDVAQPSSSPLKIIFVGAHFARKGGIVGLRMAEMAQLQGIPLEVEIVSSLQQGGDIWTDPARAGFYDRYEYLKFLPNVRIHGALPNNKVIDLVGRSHFSLLTTFGDTFGFSAIESMSSGTPVIATNQGALPEFIRDGHDGILIDLELNNHREWLHTAPPDRGSERFEALFASEVDRLAQAALTRAIETASDSKLYASMRHAAHATAKRMFCAQDASRYWDDFYEQCLH